MPFVLLLEVARCEPVSRHTVYWWREPGTDRIFWTLSQRFLDKHLW